MSAATKGAPPGLRRALGLRELVLYGIILVQPTAAMPLYGNVCKEARGHVATTILIGMVAMLFTAVSYGRMANAYPSAGSAYTYVGRELHPALGYLTGWAMVFDYVLNPIISVIWCSKAAMNFAPEVPYPIWAVSFGALFTGLNLRGIQASARTNQWVAAGLGVVVALFLGAAVRHVRADPAVAAGRFLRPWYDPETFSLAAVSQGASLAMLTYIGFDAISTLSEEECVAMTGRNAVRGGMCPSPGRQSLTARGRRGQSDAGAVAGLHRSAGGYRGRSDLRAAHRDTNSPRCGGRRIG